MLQDFQSVDLFHADIGDHDVKGLLIDAVEGLPRVFEDFHIAADLGQGRFEPLAHDRFIIEEQYLKLSGHGSSPCLAVLPLFPVGPVFSVLQRKLSAAFRKMSGRICTSTAATSGNSPASFLITSVLFCFSRSSAFVCTTTEEPSA